MPVDKNGRSSYLMKKVIIETNFFYHINNMGVEVILHRGSPHIYNICGHIYKTNKNHVFLKRI